MLVKERGGRERREREEGREGVEVWGITWLSGLERRMCNTSTSLGRI